MPTRLPAFTLCALCLALGGLLPGGGGRAAAHPTPGSIPEPVAASSWLFALPEGNVLLHIGTRESLVVGALCPRSTAAVRRFIALRRAPTVRFALAADGPGVAQFGDGGWTRAGALTVAHERLRTRMVAAFKDTARPAAGDLRLPGLGFSQVQQIYLADGEIHAVHQSEGYGDADVSVHFEQGGILYLGALVTSDGYPDLDLDHGGTIDGLIRTVDWFVGAFASEADARFVPARGAVMGGDELRAYLVMLKRARELVWPLVEQGHAEAQIIAADPLNELDPRWGRGPVSSARFTALLARSLKAH